MPPPSYAGEDRASQPDHETECTVQNSKAFGALTERQADLMREAEPERMNLLHEDELLDLRTRIRRARNKYVGIHRREGSARVGPKGSRGKANRGNRLNAEKVEVFEYALASVSERVAVVARQAAEDLKAQRLAAVAAVKSGTGPDSVGAATSSSSVESGRRRTKKTTGGRKRDASSIAAGARRQAKRDSR